jgi:hypothetical protein
MTERDFGARDVAGGQAPFRRQDFLRRPDSKGGEIVPVPDSPKIALGHSDTFFSGDYGGRWP